MPLICSSRAALPAERSSRTDFSSAAGASSSAAGASHIHTLDIARREGCCSIMVGAKPEHKEQITQVSQLMSVTGGSLHKHVQLTAVMQMSIVGSARAGNLARGESAYRRQRRRTRQCKQHAFELKNVAGKSRRGLCS